MSLSRIAQKRDANETPLVHVFEALGCSVDRTPGGEGRPDLVVGDDWKGVRFDYRVEVKMPGEKLNDKQMKYHREWKGAPIYLVHDEAEVIALVKFKRDEAAKISRFFKML